MEQRKQGFIPLKTMAEQALAALPLGYPANWQLEGMVEWASMLIEHYDNLMSTWQAPVAER
ncbi:MAG: hypothetical protein GTO14_03765 [Anaerolineales bacterium]|nr:hypothetical protein [Anaerolineales bacterium]